MRKCKECGSYAINHCSHGRDGSDVDLCDVCYWRKRATSIQQAEETHWKLSCGCPTQYGGIPAQWATTDREGSPAIAYGVICEKHWHEYDAQHPPCAWQRLTDKEIFDAIQSIFRDKSDACELRGFTRFIETKLMEKNT